MLNITLQFWWSLAGCTTPPTPTAGEPAELCEPWRHEEIPWNGAEITLCTSDALHATAKVEEAITPASLAIQSRAIFDAVGRGRKKLRAARDGHTRDGLSRRATFALTSCSGSHHAIEVKATTARSRRIFYTLRLLGSESTFADRLPDGVALMDCGVQPVAPAETPTVVAIAGLARGPARVRCSDGTAYDVNIDSESMTQVLPAIECALVREDLKYPIVFRGGRSQTCAPNRPGSNLYDCI